MPSHQKVLIIEDCPKDRELIKEALTNLHCSFEISDNLEEGYRRTEEFVPAVVILDIGIPRFQHSAGMASFLDILDYVNKFRDKHASVILTGAVQPEHVMRAMSAGACDFLSKDKLSNRIEFETRIQQAILLHNSLLSKRDNADILFNQAAMRALQESSAILFEKMDKKVEMLYVRIGEIQDRKDELLKKQSFEAGREMQRKAMRKHRALVWGGFVSTLWIIGKFIWDFGQGLLRK